MPSMEPPVVSTSCLAEKCKGVAFSLAMVLSAFFGSVYVLMPLVPLIFIWPSAFRRIIDRLIGFWLVMPMGLMEYVFGVRVFVSGDAVESDRPALILMNHRTRLDWLFFWNALFRMDPWLLTTEKISLKGILKYVPGAGWAMASNAFIFLDRTFAKDKPRIDALVNYYKQTGGKYQLLLFPEGTDKCPIATERSRTFGLKNELTHYDYVLHPRTTGFAYILQQMRSVGYVDYVYDVTCAYSDAIIQSEFDLVMLGLTPKEVHYDIRKIAVKDLPTTDEALEAWLKNLWAEKEERLRKFYTGLKLDRSHRLDTLPGARNNFPISQRSRILQKAAVAFWTTMTASWVLFFFTYPYQGYVALVTCAFFIGAQQFCGGIELLLADQTRKEVCAKSHQHKADFVMGNSADLKDGKSKKEFFAADGTTNLADNCCETEATVMEGLNLRAGALNGLVPNGFDASS